ncbi:GNAT family N-acetyltransferase [Shewanella psychropiezotolerans]|uniref:GNAT family N-acetyltransferase n=1 Tax=Shewanella psychropiezotolerans TaxID=2593655 RepID=A0ABX5X1F7_9GAMM|nr:MULTISPECIES: GNAT family N-acetyltransferase [Shewanella]MPY21150.1 GNAT family N-acetyltransferase [Shewanella sp. YLB-07]MPY21937.1 GNAT family N-acetyltransferase [Shewanella sp. YLB-07]QDO85179.1 GNAT family N-acetyltransferase [Shewanella psychropiezotolerans]
MKLIWLDNLHRRGVYGFYRSYMPYTRISRKEQIALLINDDEHTFPPDSYIKAEQIIAGLRFRPIGEFNLLNGMLVHPDHRGKGIGHQLMKRVTEKLTSKETYLFSLPHLVEFYRKHGFSQDVQAPNDIEQLFNKYTSQGKDLVMMGYIKVKNQNR